MPPTKESGANVVAAGPGFNSPEAAIQQKRLLSLKLKLKQSQGAKRKGLRETHKFDEARSPKRLAMRAAHSAQAVG